MGCDIHSYAERRNKDGKWVIIPGLAPFNNRDYGIFGFLANVRNYSAVPPIADRRGFPVDASPQVDKEYLRWAGDAHSASWLSMEELTAFNYDAMMEDRRCTRNNDGGSTCNPGEGKAETFREFLGKWFFADLEKLKESGAERIVFWFDN